MIQRFWLTGCWVPGKQVSIIHGTFFILCQNIRGVYVAEILNRPSRNMTLWGGKSGDGPRIACKQGMANSRDQGSHSTLTCPNPLHSLATLFLPNLSTSLSLTNLAASLTNFSASLFLIEPCWIYLGGGGHNSWGPGCCCGGARVYWRENLNWSAHNVPLWGGKKWGWAQNSTQAGHGKQ